MPAAKRKPAADEKVDQAVEDSKPVDQQGKPAPDEKPMTPEQALARASERARVWATPVKQEAAAKAKADKAGE